MTQAAQPIYCTWIDGDPALGCARCRRALARLAGRSHVRRQCTAASPDARQPTALQKGPDETDARALGGAALAARRAEPDYAAVEAALASHPPSPLTQRIWRFLGALVTHLRRGAPRASQRVVAARAACCATCVYYDCHAARCRLCGCRASPRNELMNKLTWADQSCPIGRWRRVDDGPPESAWPALAEALTRGFGQISS